jgi:hypothetical protein
LAPVGRPAGAIEQAAACFLDLVHLRSVANDRSHDSLDATLQRRRGEARIVDALAELLRLLEIVAHRPRS